MSETVGVTENTITQLIEHKVTTNMPKTITEPSVYQLPLATKDLYDFLSYSMTFTETCASSFYSLVSTSLYNVVLYFYNIVYIAMEAWFLNGPRWIPGFSGNAGLPESTICANLIGTNSNFFEGAGSATCKQYIHQIVTERSSFTCLIIICWYLQYGLRPTFDFFYSVYNYKDYQRVRELREKANEKSSRTKKKNQDIMIAFQALCALLRNDDIFFASQLNAMRNVVNNINNEDVHDIIQWAEVKYKIWESQKQTENQQFIRSLGNGEGKLHGEHPVIIGTPLLRNVSNSNSE